MDMNKEYLEANTIPIGPDIVPEPGDTYFSKGYGPWSTTTKVLVLDVKDGFVRYRINAAFPDERKRVVNFMQLYTKDTRNASNTERFKSSRAPVEY